MIKIFFDSSALFSATLSSTGASRELIRLSMRGDLQILISEDVKIETRRNLNQKVPKLLPVLEALFQADLFIIVPDPSISEVRAAEEYVAQKDAVIIAAAKKANVNFLATFDRKHLIDPPEVSRKSGVNTATPGDILKLLKETSP